MLVLGIEFSNFRQYKNQKINFPQNGLIGIVGNNGAGKSTLFNAIGWALYGKIKGVTQNMIKNQNASKKDSCFVKVDFLFQGKHYRVNRDIISSKSYAQVDGMVKAIGTTSLNAFIEEDVFKMDHNAFCTCYYAEQDDFDALVKLNPGPRVATLTKLLRIETIDKAAESTRKDFRNLELEVNEAKKHTKNEEELISEKKSNFSLKEEHIKELERLDKSINSIVENYKDLLVKKNEGEGTFRLYQQLLSDKKQFASQIETLNTHTMLPSQNKLDKLILLKRNYDESFHVIETFKNLQSEEKELSSLRVHFNEKLNVEKEISSLKEEVTKYASEVKNIKLKIDEIGDVDNLILDKNKLISETENNIAEISDKIKELSVNAKTKREKFLVLKSEKESFSNLGTGVPCPTCFQDLGEEHINQELERREKELNELVSEGKALQEKAQKLDNERKELKVELENHKKDLSNLQLLVISKNKYNERYSILTVEVNKRKETYQNLLSRLEVLKDINFDKDRFEFVGKEIERLSKKYEQLVKSEEIIKEIEPLKEEINSTKKIISDFRNKIKESEEKLEEINFDEATYNNLSSQIEVLNESINNLKEDKSKLEMDIKVLEINISNIDKIISENKDVLKSISNKEKEMVVLSKLDEVYKGYKTDRLNKLSPALSSIMSNYIEDITNGKYDQIELDDKYNIFIYRNGIKNPLEFYSGGEKKLAALCQRLAISELIVNQTGQLKFDMLAMDEVLGAMDNDRQDSIMEMLRNLNDTFSQILIVAHNEHAKELFDYVLEIKQDKDGNSTVSWSSDWDESEVEEIINEYEDNEEEVS